MMLRNALRIPSANKISAPIAIKGTLIIHQPIGYCLNGPSVEKYQHLLEQPNPSFCPINYMFLNRVEFSCYSNVPIRKVATFLILYNFILLNHFFDKTLNNLLSYCS